MVDVDFSIDVFDREELKEVAFLYSDYVRGVSEGALYTGNSPVTLSEFVEHDLVFYVEEGLERLNNPKNIYTKLKGRMEDYGVQFESREKEVTGSLYQGDTLSMVGVVGSIEFYHKDYEESVVDFDITVGDYENWLSRSAVDGSDFDERFMYPMSEVLNDEMHGLYESSSRKGEVDLVINEGDLNESFLKDIRQVFEKEYGSVGRNKVNVKDDERGI